MSQELKKDVLDLVKHPYEYMADFEKSKEELVSKEKYYSSLTGKKIGTKNMIKFFNFGTNLKWKRCKIITTCI